MPIAVCPNCATKIRFPETLASDSIRCPRCGVMAPKPTTGDAWFYEGMKPDEGADLAPPEIRVPEPSPPAYAFSAPPAVSNAGLVASMGWGCFLGSWCVVGAFMFLGSFPTDKGNRAFAIILVMVAGIGVLHSVATFLAAMRLLFQEKHWIGAAAAVAALASYSTFTYFFVLILKLLTSRLEALLWV